MEAASPQRYSRLPKEGGRRDNDQQTEQPTSPADAHPAEHVVVMEEDEDDGDENSSLMEEPSNVDGIFRKFKDRLEDTDAHASTTSTTASSNRPISPLHINSLISQSHSAGNSFDLDADWDEDEAGLSRYHRDLRTDIPLPAEFSHDSLPKRLWQSFLELRLAARQRRAARLLTMPSESSWKYKARSCVITWCCDATDYGILLAACLLALWLLVGWMVSMGNGWWLTGAFFLTVRVSARRLYENWQGHRRRLRQRLSTTEITSTRDASGGLWRETSNASSKTANFEQV